MVFTKAVILVPIFTLNGILARCQFNDWLIPMIPELSNSEIYDLKFDDCGIMWIGCDKGLCTFDGYNLSIYDKSNGLPGNEVYELHKAQDGKMWVGTNEKVCYIEYNNIVTPSGQANGIIRCFSEDLEGNIYFVSGLSSIYQCTPEKKLHDITPKPLGSARRHLLNIANDTLSYLESEQIISETISDKTKILTLSLDTIATSQFKKLNQKYNRTLFNLLNGLYSLDGDSISLIYRSKEHKVGQFFAFNDTLIACIINKSEIQVVNSNNSSLHYNVNFDKMRLLTIDYFGGDYFWIGTDKGLYAMPLYAIMESDIQVIARSFLTEYKSLTKTESNLYCWDDDANLSQIENDTLHLMTTLSQSHLQNIHNIAESAYGLWIATEDVYLFSRTNMQKILNNVGSCKWLGHVGSTLYIASSKGLIAITNEDIHKFLEKADRIEALDSFYIFRNRIQTATFSNDNQQLWFSGPEGLHSINLETREIVKHLSYEETGLVTDILTDKDGIIWLKTFDKIYAGSPRHGRHLFTPINPAWKFSRLLENGKKIYGVWNNKLYNIYSSESDQNYTISENPIILPHECVSIHVENNSIYVLTKTALFKINNVRSISEKEPIVTQSLYIQHSSLRSALNQTIQIRLDSHLKICAIPPNLIFPNEHYCEFRLLPVSDRWIETPNFEIDLTSTPPGTYELQSHFYHRLSGKALDIKTAHITICPTFTQYFAFKITVAAIMLIFCYVGIHFFKRIKTSGKLNSLKINELEQIANRAQVSPHMIFNLMSSLKVMAETRPREEISESIELFAQYIRQTLDYSDRLFIFIEDEIQLLENYVTLEKRRFGDRIIVLIERPSNLHEKTIEFPAMLIQPIVENAIKHGFKSDSEVLKIEVNFKITSSEITVTVKDDGRGIDPFQPRTDKSRKPWGLNLVRQRIFLIEKFMNVRASLTVTNRSVNKSQGTIVEIRVPRIH